MGRFGEQQLLDLDAAPAFMKLVKTEATFNCIDHMIEHGKPFREPIAHADERASAR